MYTVAKDGALVTWDCSMGLREMQDYIAMVRAADRHAAAQREVSVASGEEGEMTGSEEGGEDEEEESEEEVERGGESEEEEPVGTAADDKEEQEVEEEEEESSDGIIISFTAMWME